MRSPAVALGPVLVFLFLLCPDVCVGSRPYMSPGTEKALAALLAQGLQKVDVVRAMVNVSLDQNPQCLRDVTAYVSSLDEGLDWAASMLDSTANPGSGILHGRSKWLGDFDQCLEVRASYNDSSNGMTRIREFKGAYCNNLFSILGDRNAFPINMWGVCLPDSCGNVEAQFLMSSAFVQLGVSEFSISSSDCHTDDKPELPARAIGTIAVLSVLGFILLLGTAVDLYTTFCSSSSGGSNDETVDGKSRARQNGGYVTSAMELQNGKDTTKVDAMTVSENGRTETNGGTPDVYRGEMEEAGRGRGGAGGDKHNEGEQSPLEVTRPRSLLVRLLKCFSLWTNGQKLLDTSHPKGSLTCVHGIRVFSYTWVALGHAPGFLGKRADNQKEFEYQRLQDWTYQVFDNFTHSVDSFFLLGGLLVAYVTLRELKKTQGKKNWLLFYVHRYLRITPLYVVSMGIYVALMPLWVDSPIWRHGAYDNDYCVDKWWANLLYIQNLMHFNRMCMNWAWYLAMDMQFYVLSPLIVAPLFFKPILGYVSAAVFFLATSITPWVLSSERYYDTYITKIKGYSIPTGAERWHYYYIAPYCRMGPYVIGILLGYVIYKTGGKCRIPRWVNLTGWLLATAMGIINIYGLAWYVDTGVREGIELELSSAYQALSRSAWVLAVGWVIFSCHHGYGGWVNSFLSWAPLVTLGRLCFSAYLLHPIFYGFVAMGRSVPFHLDLISVTSSYLGNVVAVFLASFFMTLCFEVPVLALEKVIFKRK